MQGKGIYLDSQATAGLAPGVLDAMIAHFSDAYGNPHSSEHAYGWRASDAVDRAREQVASATGFDADEVIFTSGATEANNLAILGFDRDAAPAMAATSIEHKSVIAPIRERARRGSATALIPVDLQGVVEIDALEEALRTGARLVSVMAVNNEIGVVQPIARIAELCHAAGALLHVDAAQALAFDAVAELAAWADMVSVSSHKAGGPAGVGALLVARHARPALSPVTFGGGQEDGLRPGTLPMPLCVGFAAACSVLPNAEEVENWRRRADRLADLLAAAIPGSVRNGGGAGSHPGNVSVTLPQGDADAVIARLQPRVAVSTGSACTSGIPEPSHVLRAIGLDAPAAERTIRLSVGRYTGMAEVELAAEAVAVAVGRRAEAA